MDRATSGLTVLTVTAASLVLRVRVPVPIGRSGVDDILFVRTATAIANGQWLGPFDDLTLAKGPAYPLFVAGVHAVGLPLKLGEQVTYLVACGVLAVCVRLATGRGWLAVGVYGVLALNPVTFSFQSAELLRDSWHGSLTLLLIGSVFLTALLLVRGSRALVVLLSAVGAGLTGAAFWLCREEGVAIVPALLVVAVGVPVCLKGATVRRAAVRRATLALGAASAAFLLPMAAVSALNEHYYQTGLTNDFAAGTFASALATWTRVDGGSALPQVPLTARQRELAYQVSPAARELEPFMEAADSHYSQISCHAAHCDYPGSLLPWQLRLAAAEAGHVTSGAAEQAYFARLGDELRHGCDTGELRCTPALPTALQPLQRTTPTGLLGSFGTVVVDTALSRGLLDVPTSFWPDPLGQLPTTLKVVAGIPDTHAAAAAQAEDFARHTWPYDVLATVYRLLLPLAALVALVATLAGWWVVRRPSRVLLVLVAALLVGFVSRSALLAVVNTAEFDVAVARYEIAGQMMFAAFAVLGSAVALDWTLSRGRARADAQ